jgi:hypothetical protein
VRREVRSELSIEQSLKVGDLAESEEGEELVVVESLDPGELELEDVTLAGVHAERKRMSGSKLESERWKGEEKGSLDAMDALGTSGSGVVKGIVASGGDDLPRARGNKTGSVGSA